MRPRQHQLHRDLALHLAAKALEAPAPAQRQAGYAEMGELGASLARIAAGVVLGCIGLALLWTLWIGLVRLFGTGG